MFILRWLRRHSWSIVGVFVGGAMAGLLTTLAGIPIGPFGIMGGIAGAGVGRIFDEGKSLARLG